MSSALLFILVWDAHAATIQECNDARKQDIQLCQQDLSDTTDQSAQNNAKTGAASTDVKLHGGDVLQSAYTQDAALWSKLAKSCKEKLEDCERKCKVEPQYQTYADQYAKQCREKIQKVIDTAKTTASNSEAGAIASAGSTKEADSSDRAAQRERGPRQDQQDEARGVQRSGASVYRDGANQNLPSDIAPADAGMVQQTAGVVSAIDFPLSGGGRGTLSYDPNGGGTSLTVPNAAGTTTTNSYDANGNWKGGSSGWRPR